MATTVCRINISLHSMTATLRKKVKSYFTFLWAPVDVCFHIFTAGKWLFPTIYELVSDYNKIFLNLYSKCA